MRIRFVCPHCKVARTWASSRVLAGHYLASQTQVAMLMYCTTIILLHSMHAGSSMPLPVLACCHLSLSTFASLQR